jgi:hypothetical protein
VAKRGSSSASKRRGKRSTIVGVAENIGTMVGTAQGRVENLVKRGKSGLSRLTSRVSAIAPTVTAADTPSTRRPKKNAPRKNKTARPRRK